MSYQDREKERLAKLRDRQLSARNPRKSDERVMRQVARRGRHQQKKVTFGEMVRELPHKWRGLFMGIIGGMLLWILFGYVGEGLWVDLAGVLAMAFLPMLGFVMGRAFDLRDDLRRF